MLLGQPHSKGLLACGSQRTAAAYKKQMLRSGCLTLRY